MRPFLISPPSCPPAPIARGLPHHATFQRGMSLIELLVAMFITMIIMGVAIAVMGQTQHAVRRSLQRAQLSLAAQAIDNRLRMDGNIMLGPSSTLGQSAGAIVIVPAIRLGYVPLTNGTLSKNKVQLRSDQLAFVIDQDATTWVNNQTPPGRQWNSLIPPNLNDPTGLVSATQSMVWYGAVQDSSVAPGDGSNTDPYYFAHNWILGRQGKLLTAGAVDTAQLGITPSNDTASGTPAGLADAASVATALPGGSSVRRPGGWMDTQYVQFMANSPSGTAFTMAGAPASSATNYTNVPTTAMNIDLKEFRHNSVGNLSKGLQLNDLLSSQTRLVEHCSEVVIQWAGDLDKDGIMDTYPAGHPLAGSIVWYPEEIHDKGAWYNGRTSKMDPASADTYNNQIKPNRWSDTFPPGFMGPSINRFNGHGTQSAGWYAGFELEYGEQDNPGLQVTAPTRNIPAPYVFHFCDDQYRKVRYGFRQDGSFWKNANDGDLIPYASGGFDLSPGLHYFPYPPATTAMAMPGPNSGVTMYVDPDMKKLYAGLNPPAVPALQGVTNFADALNSESYPGPAPWQMGLVRSFTSVLGAAPLRLTPTGAYPNGRLITDLQFWAVQTGTKPGGSYVMLYVVLGGNSTAGAESIFDPSLARRSEPLPGFPLGKMVNIGPSVEAGFATGALVGNQITASGWFSIRLGVAALGTEEIMPVVAYDNYMTSDWGPANNYTSNYYEVYDEWLRGINDTTLQKTRDDWRNPQSDWPRLIRIRLRLHDAQGAVSSYSDEALVNGRDDDGDGVVDNPEEGRMSGLWYEIILAVPSPRDPSPRTHTP